MKTFAEKLKALRVERGLSQKSLAGIIGVSVGAVGNWESGTRENIRGETLLALATALDVDPGVLLHHEHAPNHEDTEELELVSVYRQLSSEEKKVAVRLLRALKSAA